MNDFDVISKEELNKVFIDNIDMTDWEELEVKYHIAHKKPTEKTEIIMQLYKQVRELIDKDINK